MNRILVTDKNNILALVARVALGIVVLPHGAQKLLGWFGGYGFQGTMEFMTQGLHLPYIIALLVILVEFFGALFLIFGFLTRISALGILGTFTGIVITAHLKAGFFMNWYGQADATEGLEYFILLFGLAIISLLAGGGKFSVDTLLFNKKSNDEK